MGGEVVSDARPAFYALDDAKTPMLISLASIVVNAVACYFFRGLLSGYGLGHVGVALATSSVALVNFFALALLMRNRIQGLNGRQIASGFARIAIASAAMSAVCYFAYNFITQQFAAKSLGVKLIEAFVPIALGGITFLVVAKLLGVSELDQLFKAVAAKVGGRKQ